MILALWKTFSTLTQAEIDEVKERLRAEMQDQRQPDVVDDARTLN
jgi:hypothetical protein